MPASDPLMDADALLALTSELREVSKRIEESGADDDQQLRWQRHLAGIAEGATSDLEKAHAQLRRFVATLDRTT